MRAAPKWDERIGARIQRAYADILKHSETCRDCPNVRVRCETGVALWRAHREAVSAR